MTRTASEELSETVARTQRQSLYQRPRTKVLEGWTRRLVWNYRCITQLEEIELPLSLDFDTLVASVGAAKQLARGRVQLQDFDPDGGGDAVATARLSVQDAYCRRGPRRYIPDELGVEGFFRCLNEANVQYAVLRWFDELPDLPEGEDIDLLVADDDVELVEELTDHGLTGQPLDLYSASGLPGTDYNKVAYYPPHLARQLLDQAVMDEGRWRVPCPRHHFLSMAHHVVYHKGDEADLAPRDPDDERAGSHDYHATLSALADELDMEMDAVALDELYRVLHQHDWEAPEDQAERLALRNPWLQQKIDHNPDPVIHRGLGAFLVRQRAVEQGFVPRIVDSLRQVGFSIIHTEELDRQAQRRLTRSARGGNWQRGPWPVSGGPPGAIIVTCDVAPVEPTAWQRKFYPLLTNARLLEKSRIREQLNAQLPEDRQFNMIHSADHGTRALEYIECWNPDRADEMVDAARRYYTAFQTRRPVLREEPADHLVRHQIIEFQGEKAIKRTFRPGRRQFVNRQIEASKRFGWRRPEFLPVLEEGHNYVIHPWVDDVIGDRLESGKLLPLEAAQQALQLMRFLYDQGYALIDAGPSSFRYDENRGLKLVNAAYLYEYEEKPPTFADSFDIAGIPEKFDGPTPPGLTPDNTGYEARWQPVVGVDFHTLVDDDVGIADRLRRQRRRIGRRREHVVDRHVRPATPWVKRWLRQIDGLVGLGLVNLFRGEGVPPRTSW